MIEKFKFFEKLSSRQKLLVIGLASVIGVSLYINTLYKPLSRKISRNKFQIKKSTSRLSELKANFPEVEKQKENIRNLNIECDDLLNRIVSIEKGIPSRDNISQLLAELNPKAEDLRLVSMRQRIDDGSKYSRLFIELKFNVSYKKIINYIHRVESLSPFIVTEEFDIYESKSKKEPGPQARLVLSTLLGDVSSFELFKAKEEEIDIARDIFLSTAKPVIKKKEITLKLEGITYSSQGSTAIVDGDVIREGSEIGGFKVKEIRRYEIVLTDDIEEHILSVNQR